ncbi:pyridoxal-dependent decarboxylase, partial [Mycobacterium kansasii]
MSQLTCVPRVYASTEAHSCHTKAVEALGIGSAHITRIPTDADQRMRPADLDAQLKKDTRNGILPVAVIA